jgi:Defence against restriction A C-terminal
MNTTKTLTVYRYGLSYRPPGVGATPTGMIFLPGAAFMQPNYDAKYLFGTIDYPQPLSDAEIKGYQLTYDGTYERSDREALYWLERNS